MARSASLKCSQCFTVVRLIVLLLSFSALPCACSQSSFKARAARLRRRSTRWTSPGLSRRTITPVSYRSQRAVPIHDDFDDDDETWYQKRGYRPWNVDFSARSPGSYSWTSRIVMANVFFYGCQVFFPSITQMGVKLSDRILRGEELYRLFTPMFLHGGITHLMTNVYSLQSVGHDVERYFGPGRFLATYCFSGMVANLVSAIKSPNPSLGASGAVFGIVSAYYVFLNRNMHLFGRQGEYMAGAVSRTIIMNMFLGAMVPMVDNWGHLGGALGGAVASFYFGPRLMVADTPNGARTIVDKPILRLPRSIEAIPEKMADRLRIMKRRMQVESIKSELPDKPWRRKAPPGPDYRQRRSTPDKSVRPSF